MRSLLWRPGKAAEAASPLCAGPSPSLFGAQQEALGALASDVSRKEQQLRTARRERDEATAALIALMALYRQAAASAVFDHPELAADIPVLFVRRRTAPDAVTLAGTWADGAAGLTWSPSAEDRFAGYHVRARAGTRPPGPADTLVASLTDREQTSLAVTE